MKRLLLFLITIQLSHADIIMPEYIIGHFNDCSQKAVSDVMIYDEAYVSEYISDAGSALSRMSPDNRNERIGLWFEGVFLTRAHRKFKQLTNRLSGLTKTHPNPVILAAKEQHIRDCLSEEICLPELPPGLSHTFETLGNSLVEKPIDEELMRGYIEVIDTSLENCSR
jgi:hypothetical protein